MTSNKQFTEKMCSITFAAFFRYLFICSFFSNFHISFHFQFHQHDRGNLNMTFFTPRERYNRAYNLKIVTRALFREWGIKADISARDDIVINDKKVSDQAEENRRTERNLRYYNLNINGKSHPHRFYYNVACAQLKSVYFVWFCCCYYYNFFSVRDDAVDAATMNHLLL